MPRPPLSVLAALALASALRAEPPPGPPVLLPPFMVEARPGPAVRPIVWRHFRTPEYDFLYCCADSQARALAEAAHRLHGTFDALVPAALRLRWDAPQVLVLYGEDQPAPLASSVLAQVRGAEGGAPAAARLPEPARRSDGLGTVTGALPGEPGGASLGEYAPAPRYGFLDNLQLLDADERAVFAIMPAGGLDARRLSLRPEYVSHVLRAGRPAPPAWFVDGFLGLYPQMRFGFGSVAVPRATWISDPLTRAAADRAYAERAVLDLSEFFLNPDYAEGRGDPGRRLAWLAQAQLLIRWALDPSGPPSRRPAFWRFVEDASRGPAGEAPFRRRFGFGLAEGTRQLRAFLPEAVARSASWAVDPAAPLPALEPRDATPGEVARIKGEFERLEVGYVRAHLPAFEAEYLAQARRTLRRGYDRGDRDPRLLASLGLCECDAGEPAAARPLLEQAVAREVARPRAYVALARLRLEEARGRPEGPGDRLSPDQAEQVLGPLRAGRRLAPPLAESYELAAAVLAETAGPATEEELAALREGAALFPGEATRWAGYPFGR